MLYIFTSFPSVVFHQLNFNSLFDAYTKIFHVFIKKNYKLPLRVYCKYQYFWLNDADTTTNDFLIVIN